MHTLRHTVIKYTPLLLFDCYCRLNKFGLKSEQKQLYSAQQSRIKTSRKYSKPLLEFISHRSMKGNKQKGAARSSKSRPVSFEAQHFTDFYTALTAVFLLIRLLLCNISHTSPLIHNPFDGYLLTHLFTNFLTFRSVFLFG